MQLPAMVGKYELLEFLGGGMSHVYRGRDTMIGRAVVVKLLTPESCTDADAKARFLQEAKLAGNLQHENIVGIFDFGEHDGRPFIVMEYLKGEDLRDAIRGGRTGSLLDRLKIAHQIALALEHVNSQGIVHRDIKPENVHIDPKGRVKLMDFGIAKTEDLSLTRTGMAMGTPYYMAPEQIAGRKPTPQVDVYAFGLLLYELLTGSRAVNGDSMEAVLYQIMNVPLDPAPMVNAGVPPAARALVMQCVQKEPASRPQGFRPIVEQLRAIMSPQTPEQTQAVLQAQKTQPLPAVPVAKKPSLLPWIALAGILVALAAASAWWFLRPKPGLPAEKPQEKLVVKVPEIPPVQGMVYIEPGEFLFGETNQKVQNSGFYIDETEVSNADFAEFCRATGCAEPQGAPDLPVTGVTIAQARQFASWKGKRLPIALEWERAARGTDGAKYPWGNAEDASFVKGAANLAANALKPVKSYEAYRGLYQMAGNAWEMVDTLTLPSAGAVASFATLIKPAPSAQEKWIEIRGGSFNTPLQAARGYEWSAIPERYASKDIGFRCAKSP
jgi:serine/threonine-protein kinase